MTAKNTQNGFTLIEVLIAMTVLTIGVLSLITMQSTAIRGNSTSNRITEATTQGADEIEKIFSREYSSDTSLEDTDNDSLAGLDDAECCDDGNDPLGNTVTGCTAKADTCLEKEGYFLYINVAEDQPLTATPGYTKTIRIIVNRTDIDGVTKTVSYNYYRTKNL